MGGVEASLVATDSAYRRLFADAFPGAPIDRERAGLAIAAYERTLLANRAPFQRWLRGERGAMTAEEKRGAVLFFGKAACADCHAGPALSSMTFHALGMGDLEGADVVGVPDEAVRRGRGAFTGRAEEDYQFKTPPLYNLADVAFFGHGGTFGSVREVVAYKNRAVAENADVPADRLAEGFRPLRLTASEVDALAAFLEGALYDPDLQRYVPEVLPSGNCPVANDEQARTDLGC